MSTPLTIQSVFESWRWDASTVVLTVALAAGYGVARARAARRGESAPAGRAAAFLLMGTGVWLLTGISAIGAYSDTLFWVRALQTLLLLYVVPFGLAAGRPVTVLRGALGPGGRAWVDRALASSFARAVTYPLVASLLVLATPWILFLSPWFEVVLRHGAADALTRILLVAIGFLYFYSRLQTDPVPHRYSQSISLLITVFESLADGILGLALWLGPLVAAGYYGGIGRTWGPDPRMDQIIGAGIIWVLGDVLGLPYLLTLMRSWAADERRHARELDAALDALEVGTADDSGEQSATIMAARSGRGGGRIRGAVTAPAENREEPPTTGLWWENDPQLRERFRR
ncbi:cytochrome c oxidase assembly protein [Nocardia sp. alder85J]|uniref:cytochrome c oxidase assembly protein n=1 Tax=Nocardia sp. alder85J TaxID=2862949 RepID=UPI001CD67AD7|nr:cytochrome c oxidase assembly protein [Nocardia sp. alder85J]MCX4094910.1 cytochrome c oxidase assembly protein [Nocardia sp. alder85J]